MLVSLKHNCNFPFFVNQTEDDEETNLLRIQAVLTYLQQQEIGLKASAKGEFVILLSEVLPTFINCVHHLSNDFFRTGL